jgi:Glycosyltransferase family 87
MSLKYVLIALKYQNVHLIVLSLFVIAFCLWLKGRIVPAAALMALAISIKIFPLIAMPYFLIKRQWKFTAMTGAFLAVFLFLPSFYFGISGNIALHRQWFDHVVTPSEFHVTNGPVDLSVQGQVKRYFSEVNYAERENDREYRNINIVSFEPDQVKTAGMVAALLIFGATFGAILFAYRIKRGQDVPLSERRSVFHEFGLVVCMMLLVGPRTNIIYMSAIFLPLTALLYSWKTTRSRGAAAALVIVSIVSVLLPLVPGAKTQRLFLVLGTDFFAVFMVWIALLWILLATKPKAGRDGQAHLP